MSRLNLLQFQVANVKQSLCDLQQLAGVLKGRLTLKNAHKQWLALELVQEVCALCGAAACMHNFLKPNPE